MKNIVSNVYWYYVFSPFGGESGKCDDFLGNIHFFYKQEIKKFKEFPNQFILDIDLDFFAEELDWKWRPFSDKLIDKYLKLQKKIFLKNNCVGMTIALEPFFCGGIDGCLYLLKKLSEVFELDIFSKSKKLLDQ